MSVEVMILKKISDHTCMYIALQIVLCTCASTVGGSYD